MNEKPHEPDEHEGDDAPQESVPLAPDATTENPDGTVPDYGTE